MHVPLPSFGWIFPLTLLKWMHTSLPQVHAGKDVLNSELVLPSGMGLSLGAMIHVMRRRKVMDGIFEVQGGGEAEQGREGKGGRH